MLTFGVENDLAGVLQIVKSHASHTTRSRVSTKYLACIAWHQSQNAERTFSASLALISPYTTSPSTPATPARIFASAFRKVVHPEPGRPTISAISPDFRTPLKFWIYIGGYPFIRLFICSLGFCFEGGREGGRGVPRIARSSQEEEHCWKDRQRKRRERCQSQRRGWL